MANELDTNQEAILNSIAAAIKTLTSTGVDINPYSVAREAEIDPVQIFNSKAAMDQLIAARGDKVSYSIDAELSLQYQEISQELEKAVAINQELYDRGSELAERVVELEAKVNDLEQEAEQLAMQLQNAWTVGYQKGLAAAREQAQAQEQASAPAASAAENVQNQKPAPAAGPTPPTQPQSTSQAQAQAETQTLTKDQLQQLAQVEAQVQAKRSPPPVPAPSSQTGSQAGSITGDEIPVQPQADSMRAVESNGEFTVNDLPSHEQLRPAGNAELVGYNDRVFNAVKEGPAGPKPSDLYSALSWKQIETVYQYSATPGRTGANLYFDPLPSPEADQEQPLSQQAPEPTAPLPEPPKVETQPEPALERRPKKMPNISFDPPDEPIVGASTRIEGMADSFSESLSQDPFTQSLTDIPSLGSMLNSNGRDKTDDVLQERTAEVETSSALTALPLSEPQDDLDLDKLDIFEGLEDIEELSNIEVIEDVVLPDQPSAETQASDRAQTLGPEELRELIKNRIKQAQEHPGEVDITPIQVTAPAAANAQTAQTAQAAAQAAADAAAAAAATPSAEAIRQGVRNKFIGGKGPSPATSAANPSAAPAPGSTTDGATTAAAGAGPTPAASPSPGAASAAAARSVPPEIRKNCMILGVRPEDLTVKTVIEAWKAQITAPGVHPDQGGDHETALYLNIAKETLVKYIEAQAPKLGKKFGQQAQTRETPKAPFTMRQNPDKGTDKK